MAEENIKRLYDKLEELQTSVVRIATNMEHMQEVMDQMQSDNRMRDSHIHRLEIAKREAWAIAGFLGFIIGLFLQLIK